MDTARSHLSGNVPLFPFPEGWYSVASRNSILKAGLIQKTWLGQNIVAWCGVEGTVCVAEAVCPHLGADLGPAGGGLVRDGCLVCPFHGFEYDVSGQCVDTPFAPPPKSTNLRVFETQEALGMVFAWWGIDGRPPQWRLPADPPCGSDWSELKFRTIRFPGHPQETTENSVDVTHMRYVHGYDNVKQVGRTSVNGAVLESRFEFRSTRRIAGIVNVTLDVAAVARVFGLGYSLVQVRERSIGMDSRLWVLATPVDGRLVEMVLVGQVREIRRPKRPFVGLGFLPVSLRAPIMNNFLVSGQERDVMQDVEIWARKQHRSRPRLCRSDGEIGVYRRYCAQFYPDQRDSGQERRDRRSAQE